MAEGIRRLRSRTSRRAQSEEVKRARRSEPGPEKAQVERDRFQLGLTEAEKQKLAAMRSVDAVVDPKAATTTIPTRKGRVHDASTEKSQEPVPEPQKEEVSPERKAAIDAALTRQGQPAGVLLRTPDANRSEVVSTLKGQSPLGPLSEAERRYFMRGSLDRMLGTKQDPAMNRTNYAALRALREEADRDPELRPVVSQVYAERAVEMLGSMKRAERLFFPDDRALASTLAGEAVFAAGSTRERAALLTRIGPEGSVLLSNALAVRAEEPLDSGVGGSAGSARFEERQQAGGMLLTAAAANRLYGQDPARMESEGKRLDEILDTSPGWELLTNHQLSLEQKYVHAGLLLARPEWDAAFLRRTRSAFANPEVARALALPQVKAFADQRGDVPRILSGVDLENTLGFSLGRPPFIPSHETEDQRVRREQEMAEGRYAYYQDPESSALVKPIAESIRVVGGPDPRVTVLPIQFTSASTGAVALRLYRVQDAATGADRFVDNRGRTYRSFADWQDNNQLPPGTVTYPPGGHLTPDLRLNSGATPRSKQALSEVVDTVALVGGVVAGGAMIAGSGGLLAPAVVAGAAAWGTYRSVSALDDRYAHGQSINPIASSEARAEWLGLGANVLGFSSMGAGGVARLISAESKIAPAVLSSAAALNVGANVLDTAAAVNSAGELVARWDQLDAEQRANLALSLGFWGANTVGRTRLAGAGAGELYSYRAIRDGLARVHSRSRSDLYVPSKRWEEMTPDERRADYLARFPDAQELQALDTKTLSRVFGDDPYFDTAAELGSVPGFAKLAKEQPEAARVLYDASFVAKTEWLLGQPPDLNLAVQRARSILPAVQLRKIEGTSGEVEYRVATHPTTSFVGVPVLRLSPTSALDHNGAFMRPGKVRSGGGVEIWQTTSTTRDSVSFRLDQLVLDPRTGATVQDQREVAVFSGHGGSFGFQGIDTPRAAKAMAEEILIYRQNNPSAPKLKYVVLEACSQGDRRKLWVAGETNAEEFQRVLNDTLGKLGHEPVGVLAAERAGVLYGNQYQGVLPWRRIDARYVAPENQVGGLPSNVKRWILIGSGAAAATEGGALYLLHRLREAELERERRRAR